jgi:hypothetical protein
MQRHRLNSRQIGRNDVLSQQLVWSDDHVETEFAAVAHRKYN